MLKRLAIVVLIAFAACRAWSQVPRNGSKHDQAAQSKYDPSKTDQPSAATIKNQLSAAKQEQKTDPQATGYPWHELLAPANIPNWLLVGVGLWAGCMALRTLKGMDKEIGHIESQTQILRDSVAAAQKSADAALAQIQMMKEKERARIQVTPRDFDIVQIGENDNNHMVIEFLNLGPTNAFNVRAEGDGRFTVKDFDSQELEMTDLVLPPVLKPGIPETSWVPLWFDGRAGDEVRHMQAKTTIEMKGVIEYDDVFGEGHKSSFHFQMFVYGWERSKAHPNTAKMKRMGGWCKTGPPKDNHAS